MSYIIILIAACYFLVIIAFIIGFDAVKITKNEAIAPKHSFSIVIPFRNEAANLGQLLNSISLLKYPSHLFEVILVNDESDDDYSLIIENFKHQFSSLNIILLNTIRTSNSPKKDAINLAIKKSKYDWVVTTDADCCAPNNWLTLFNQTIINKEPVFISGPVKFHTKKQFLFHFQNLNFLSLIGSTIGSFGIQKPIMCNGANLCYKKTAFLKVNGFEGNTEIASGDDLFLLQKMTAKFPSKISYIKSNEAIVSTNSESSWKLFLNQQIRWAAKSTAYKSIFSKIVGLVVFALNFMLVLLILSALFYSFYWNYLLIIYSVKLLIDFILIYKTATFLKNKNSLSYYSITSFIYPFFIVFTGILSLFKNYEWKGRSFNK
ncbi:MAG: glycosyltransferase [Lutibacter sp.]|uniref:glycosyltransferase family 2 protein n=1 Tax=Lutibacter sp. TaxID=1925666 RepID=UPI00179A764F|nr:glycosyltransferase [Lutibacter sp.]MBT8318288.1 glycosyltransferase [Lutibacter sp.]NNJ59145.1 glycosyltransferase [Lutibacter sp.]